MVFNQNHCIFCIQRIGLVSAVVLAVLLDSPQILIAEEEKIIVEEMKGNETIVEEK